jgi:hypothetical protein
MFSNANIFKVFAEREEQLYAHIEEKLFLLTHTKRSHARFSSEGSILF